MKKTILITAGVIILLIALGVWVYLVMFGAPKGAGDIFTNFGDSDSSEVDTSVDTPPQDGSSFFATVQEERSLRQLTTRPVAGMTFVGSTTVRYVEQGTGYIFDLDIETEEEMQIVLSTFTKVREAVFSKDGSAVAFTRDEARTERITVGEIIGSGDTSILRSFNLTEGASEVAFSDTATSTLYYLYETPAGSEGHMYDLETEKDSVLFTLPFSDARMIWKDRIYAYTKPSASLLGYVYEIKNGVSTFVTNGYKGLIATYFPEGVITTISGTNSLFSEAHFTEDGSSPLPPELFPEKCVSIKEVLTEIVCAVPTELPSGTYPDDWYKGAVSFSDEFWAVNPEGSRASHLIDPLEETGREIDVLRMNARDDGSQILFINKNDNTLWLFDLTV